MLLTGQNDYRNIPINSLTNTIVNNLIKQNFKFNNVFFDKQEIKEMATEISKTRLQYYMLKLLKINTGNIDNTCSIKKSN